jgi:hypothetical protein
VLRSWGTMWKGGPSVLGIWGTMWKNNIQISSMNT